MGKRGILSCLNKKKSPKEDGEQILLSVAPVLKKPWLTANSQNSAAAYYPPPSNTENGCASLSSNSRNAGNKYLRIGDKLQPLKKIRVFNHLIPCWSYIWSQDCLKKIDFDKYSHIFYTSTSTNRKQGITIQTKEKYFGIPNFSFQISSNMDIECYTWAPKFLSKQAKLYSYQLNGVKFQLF